MPLRIAKQVGHCLLCLRESSDLTSNLSLFLPGKGILDESFDVDWDFARRAAPSFGCSIQQTQAIEIEANPLLPTLDLAAFFCSGQREEIRCYSCPRLSNR